MPIRITGMYSGLDTESIITELASAQSAKKNSLVKAQTKLSWKQDAWKALNTKIYSFYSNVLSDMRFESSFQKKTTKVSNANAVSVVTGSESVNGVQNMKIEQMAKAGYLTGGDITGSDGTKYIASSTLADLGFTGSGSFTVSMGSKSTEIKVDETTKISDIVSKLQAAGVNANFDEKNQRFFVSSKTTGADGNFILSGSNEGGMKALSKLGLLAAEDIASDEYKTWADYAKPENAAAYEAKIASEVAKRAASYKKENDGLLKANQDLQDKIDKLKADPGYVADKTSAELYEELYGPETTKLDENGNAVLDDSGNPVMERNGGLKKDLDDAKAVLQAAEDALKTLEESGTATETELEQAKQAVTDANSDVTEKQAAFNEVNGQYSIVKAVEGHEATIAVNDDKMAQNASNFTVDADDNVTGTAALEANVRTEFAEKIQTAQDVLNGKYAANSTATKEQGQDAIIYLNKAEFKSDTNTFEVNGLTITVLAETNESITLTTGEDTEGIYDSIKKFFTEYNKLINEMDSMYNAESSKGYEPLLSEEKEAMAESEIEDWEKKIKDSLLRRDQTLGNIADAMKTIMMRGIDVNGKTMYLSDFGINTLGYFNAPDNERNAYHIDGDKDDSYTASNEKTLEAMIASDPETVTKFFSQLAKNVYSDLTDKMATSSLSSAFTVYNDKEMKEEYDAYKEKISKQEDKVNALMDKWYAKFSAMETALAKLESKNSAVSSMFGG
ncbi:MAG: flagellar filament capping protein FliD [Lachnospiraceae bacterium]|nr:flagellar filament capping protein FliD [Lachnospiraceae bacterium]